MALQADFSSPFKLNSSKITLFQKWLLHPKHNRFNNFLITLSMFYVTVSLVTLLLTLLLKEVSLFSIILYFI